MLDIQRIMDDHTILTMIAQKATNSTQEQMF